MSRHLFTAAFSAALLLFCGVAHAADDDGDGLSNDFEIAIGTNPNVMDSDGDNWIDSEEVFRYGTDPLSADTDGDGDHDDVDTDPLLPPSGPYDGASAKTGTGWRTGTPYAMSGESAQDGRGVYMHDGGFSYVIPVLGEGSRGPSASITLLYDSLSSSDGCFGKNIFSILDVTYSVDPGTQAFTTHRMNGVEFTATWDAMTSTYVLPDDMTGTLEETVPGEFLLITIHGTELHYAAGVLDKIADRHGNELDFIHNGSGEVTSFIDSRSETFLVSYYAGTGRVETVTKPDSSVWTFIYNGNGQLHRIEGPDTAQFPTGIDREFRYINGTTNASLNDNMTVVIDGMGVAALCIEYDEYDRVTKQWENNGDLAWEFDYSDAANDKTTVTAPGGAQRVWEWDSTKLTRKKLQQKSNLDVRTSDPTSWDTTWTHDAEGYLATVTLPRGNGVKYTRSAAKLVTERRHKEDMSVADDDDDDLIDEWAYDSTKYYGTTSYTTPGGEETTYTLNSMGQPTTITYPTITGETSGFTETFTYNSGDGSVATHTDAEGVVTKYDYYSTGANSGRTETVTVDYGTGKLNLVTEYDYAPCGMVDELTDPEGNTTTKTVECYGIVTKIESPTSLGYETKFTFDANLRMTKKEVKNVDETGTPQATPAYWTTTWEYMPENLLSTLREYSDATNYRETGYQYDDAGRLQHRERDLRITTYYYDERGLLYERERALGSGMSATTIHEYHDYDLNGNLVTYEDPRGKETAFEWDLFDRREKTINALGHFEQTIYNKDGQATERKFYEENDPSADVLMAHSKSTYDEMGRLIKAERALIDTTTTWVDVEYTLDKNGLVTVVEDELGNDTTFEFDHARRRTNLLDALGNEIDYEYDDNGNLIAVDQVEIIPGSQSTHTFRTEFDYDVVNRRTKQTVIDRTNSANKKITEWKHDSRSVVIDVIDPKGFVTTNTYDGLGQRTQESVDMGSSAAIVTQWEFDDNGNMTLLRDDNGSETEYEFDTLNRLVEKTYEDATTYAMSYDAAGNITNIVDRAGNDVDMAYDDVNRLTDRDATLAGAFGGDTTEDFTYDALGRLTEAKDDDSIVQFTYDSLGRVLTEKQGANPFGVSAKTVSYSYDAAGNTTQIDYPSSFEAHRTFDALNRLTLVEDDSSVDIADWDLYGAARRRDVVTFGNSTTATYTYDGFRRPTEIAHATSTPTQFASFEYGWDKNDNPTYEKRSHQGAKGDVYTYDNANRLVTVLQDVDDPANEVANPGTETYVDKVQYNMDDVLNFTSLVTTPYGGSAATASYTTNSMNEYTAVAGITHVYDDNGNLVDDDTYEYVYDWKNHLIEVIDATSQATIATYTYDCYGLGRRTKKVVGSDTTRFVYADQQCLEEYDGSGDLLRLFAFGTGLDEVVMMEAPDVADVDDDQNTSELKRFYFHGQLIGSITHVTDPDEVVVESYDYGPYGEIAMFDISSGSISASAIGNPFTYTGRRLDEESGLYYYRARHYSSGLKRFIQRDPLEYVDGPNAYAYVFARSTSLTDAPGTSPGVRIDPLSEANGPTPLSTPPADGAAGNPPDPGFYPPDDPQGFELPDPDSDESGGRHNDEARRKKGRELFSGEPGEESGIGEPSTGPDVRVRTQMKTKSGSQHGVHMVISIDGVDGTLYGWVQFVKWWAIWGDPIGVASKDWHVDNGGRSNPAFGPQSSSEESGESTLEDNAGGAGTSVAAAAKSINSGHSARYGSPLFPGGVSWFTYSVTFKSCLYESGASGWSSVGCVTWGYTVRADASGVTTTNAGGPAWSSSR